jgi:uncharacterized protein YidB (DUF937 family)
MMGLLDSLLGGARGGAAQSGGMSKMTMLLMALMAYRAYQGKGGLGGMLGGGQGGGATTAPGGGYLPQGNPNMQGRGHAPNPNAGPMGMPGGAMGGGGLGGGLGDLIRGGLLRGGIGGGGMGGGGMGGGGMGGGLGGLLGGLLAGGAAGGLLSGGLADLVRQFQQNGQGHVADSWVGRGANAAISPDELERGLGEDNVRQLAEQAGMPREELLSGLSEDLPHFVDSLTPEGRLPDEQEAGQWV